MATVLLPLLPGTLPEGSCFTDDQQRLVAFAAALQAVLPGLTFYNYGNTKPSVANQAYPWLNTNDGRRYDFNGVWRSPNNYSPFDRRWFAGTTTDLITYDGGSAGSMSSISGPMWVVDPDAVGRTTMSPGVIPGSDPPVTLAEVGSTPNVLGSGSHALTEAEGGVGIHTHAFGKYLSGAVGLASSGGNFTVPTYSGVVVQGISGGSGASDTIVNVFTLPSGTAAVGVATPTAFSTVPPVIGYYLVKPSGRLFYTVP